MIIINKYTRKQPAASNDYTMAYNIVNGLSIGCSDSAIPDNIKVFRKYIYDLGLKNNKRFATRLYDTSIEVTRLK